MDDGLCGWRHSLLSLALCLFASRQTPKKRRRGVNVQFGRHSRGRRGCHDTGHSENLRTIATRSTMASTAVRVTSNKSNTIEMCGAVCVFVFAFISFIQNAAENFMCAARARRKLLHVASPRRHRHRLTCETGLRDRLLLLWLSSICLIANYDCQQMTIILVRKYCNVFMNCYVDWWT